METIGPKIAAALVLVQANLKGARKTKENPHLRSKYADLASVWEACHEALTAHKVAVVQAPVYHDGLVFCKTILIHESGETVVGEYLVRPVKEDPQGFGSAFTYARRYSLCGMLGITNEDDDGNRGSGRGPKPADLSKVKKEPVITPVERIAFTKAWQAAGKTEEQVKGYLLEAYEIESTAEIKKSDLAELMAWASEKKPGAAA